MKLNQLPSTKTNSKKRRGQGYGSGKGGHTSGRGQKGQLSRGKVPTWFEGGQLPQIRRFPFIRGKSRFESLTPKPVEINVAALNRLPKNTVITPKTLIEHGFVKPRDIKYRPIKVLGRGTLETALIVSVPVSQSAQQKIEAAGGKVDRGHSS